MVEKLKLWFLMTVEKCQEKDGKRGEAERFEAFLMKELSEVKVQRGTRETQKAKVIRQYKCK